MLTFQNIIERYKMVSTPINSPFYNIKFFYVYALACLPALYASTLPSTDPTIECFPLLDIPNLQNCNRARQLMDSDLSTRYPNWRLVTRHEVQKGDIVVPRYYVHGKGEDRCVITVDVTDDTEHQTVLSVELVARATVLIFECLGPYAKQKASGQAFIEPARIVRFEVGTNIPDDHGIVIEDDSIWTNSMILDGPVDVA